MCGSSPGAKDTFAEQVCMPIQGRVQCIDKCIHQIVAALNAANVQTTVSCCGHDKMDGRIDLYDGRVLIIKKSKEEANKLYEHIKR